MSRRLKILTFNHHESYLCSLADTGHEFDVVTQVGDLDLSWNPSSKPMPANMRAVAFDEATKKRLTEGVYDWVICHTIKNLLWLWPFDRPRYVFIAHIPLFTYSLPLAFKSFCKRTIFNAFAAMRQARFVAVSDFKRRMWRKEGTVIVLTPEQLKNLLPETGYDQVVVVCNQLLNRQEELGYRMIEEIRREIPVQILGNNPGVPNAVKPDNFEDFQERLRQTRIYLYTIQYPYGDGYNTAMLEAMKLGMAIVTIANPSSPIRHGENGLVGKDAAEIMSHLKFLREHPEEVDRLGRAAQDTIATSFSKELFVQRWNDVLRS